MKKLYFLLVFLFIASATSAQQDNLLAVNYTEKALDKGIIAIKPNDMFIKPSLWLKVWIDTPVPTSMYNAEEVKYQKYLNEKAEDLVKTYSPSSDELFYANDNLKLPTDRRNIDYEHITPYTWKWLDLEKIEDGSKVTAKLRRPNWWILENKADKVGNIVYLQLPEQGISGGFTVKKIRVSQIDTRFMKFKREDDYTFRPLTGWFEHETSDVWNYTFSNGETIGATPSHPFYSERRKDYIAIGEIEIGEPIRNPQNEVITLAEKVKRDSGAEKVYNLEVYRDHNFLVGKNSLLVHNSCISDILDRIVPFNRGSRNFHLEQGTASTGWKHIYDRHIDPIRFPDKSKFDTNMTEDDIFDLLSETLKHGDETLYAGKAVFTKRLKGTDNKYRYYRATANADGSIQTFHPLD